jgi:hypothetical protein
MNAWSCRDPGIYRLVVRPDRTRLVLAAAMVFNMIWADKPAHHSPAMNVAVSIRRPVPGRSGHDDGRSRLLLVLGLATLFLV